jgi:hypothetical protein
MSFTRLRPYFIECLALVDSDFREWEDAFNIENIPSTVIDKAFHLDFGPASADPQNQTCLPYRWPVSLQIFFKGYSTPKDAVDTALSTSEAILKECLKHSKRLTDSEVSGARIVNVKSTSTAIDPLDVSNDNVVKLTMDFEVTIYIEIN